MIKQSLSKVVKQSLSKVVIVCIVTMISVACTTRNDEIKFEKGKDAELYKDALSEINKKNRSAALSKLGALETHYPKSDLLRDAMLTKLELLYSSGLFLETIVQADRCIRIFPRYDRAYYLKAMAQYKMMMDSQRDQENTREAVETFDTLKKLFPDSEFVKSSEEAAARARNMLAIKQLEIGRFYGKKGQYGASAERYQKILKDYNESVAEPEALYRMVEIYENLDFKRSARGYYKELESKYPKSLWTSKARAISDHNSFEKTK